MKKVLLALFIVLLCSFVSYAAVLDEETAKKTANDIREIVSEFNASQKADSLNSPISVSNLLEMNAKSVAINEVKRTVEKSGSRDRGRYRYTRRFYGSRGSGFCQLDGYESTPVRFYGFRRSRTNSSKLGRV